MANNDGKDYEYFVKDLQQYIINNQDNLGVSNIAVETNKIIKDNNDIDRQFDVYWEFKIGGYIYRSIIECKDYASKVTLEKIDALIGKTNDIPGLKLIIATKTGYQSGVITKAHRHNVELLVVREGNDSDWISPEGDPLINKIRFNIVMENHPAILGVTPVVNFDALSEDEKDMVKKGASGYLNTDMYIFYTESNTRLSFHDIQAELLDRVPDLEYGKGVYVEEGDGLYLEIPKGKIKLPIVKYTAAYEYLAPISKEFLLDYSQSLLGVVENITQKNKKMIFKDGVIR